MVQLCRVSKTNIENLKNVLYVQYEDLVLNQEETKQKILNFLPELETIDMTTHNVPGIHITRNRQIAPGYALRVIKPKEKNTELIKNIELLEYFGYSII